MMIQLRPPGTITQWAARQLHAPSGSTAPFPPAYAMLRRLQAWGEMTEYRPAAPLSVEDRPFRRPSAGRAWR
jgi:hypothetical protein